MKLHRFVGTGELVPKPYGVAYRTPFLNGAMCYVMPLHLVVRWLRNAYLHLKFPTPQKWEVQMAQIHERGKQIGERQAYQQCEQKMREVLAGMRMPQTGQRVLTDAEVELWVPALMPMRWQQVREQIVNERDGERRG